MGIYIEALILFIVLFFAGSLSIGNMHPKTDGFSALREVYRIFLHTIPSLALIWYMLIKRRTSNPAANTLREKDRASLVPCKNDLVSGLIAFPCLLLTGFIFAFLASFADGSASQISLHLPESVGGWIILSISVFFSAYLEESFFRFYFLTGRKEFNLSLTHIVIFSTALFSICHIYEGLWGILNSVISGLILAIIFLRYKSLHGIAIAHGLYNMAVYIIKR